MRSNDTNSSSDICAGQQATSGLVTSDSGAKPAVALYNISKSYHLHNNLCLSMLSQAWRRRVSRGATQASRAETSFTGTVRCRDFYALHDISFNIMAGESVGIIGRNGSGKSTLLQILAGIIKPSAGQGVINGNVATLLELGTGFHPDFSGRENIMLYNAMLGLSHSDSQERARRIEAFADIGAFMDEPIRVYSSGMILRLGFACAIAVDPDIFIVDEALAVGDIFFQQKCYEHMREQMSGKTRIMVSHDMHAITTFCTRVLILDGGSLVFDGPPLEAVEFYIKALHDGQNTSVGASQGKVEADAASHPEWSTSNTEAWRLIKPESVGGIGEIQIERVEISVNREAHGTVVKPGDVVGVWMVVHSGQAKSALLFGYLIRDRTGNAICGENSAGLPGGIVSASAGQYGVAFEFIWPELQLGNYFLTLGVGEGRDPIRHTIQCWAHNIHVFNAISPAKAVHGLINNPLRNFQFTPCASETITTR